MAGASLLVRAMELAESGEHIDVLTVESALAVEGYAEAFDVFKDDRLRAGIRAICHNTGDQLQRVKLTTTGLHWRANKPIHPPKRPLFSHCPDTNDSLAACT